MWKSRKALYQGGIYSMTKYVYIWSPIECSFKMCAYLEWERKCLLLWERLVLWLIIVIMGILFNIQKLMSCFLCLVFQPPVKCCVHAFYSPFPSDPKFINAEFQSKLGKCLTFCNLLHIIKKVFLCYWPTDICWLVQVLQGGATLDAFIFSDWIRHISFMN